MVTKDVILNVWRINDVVIYANSGEVDSRYIEVVFTDVGLRRISLANRFVTFYAKKPDGTSIFKYCTVDSVNDTATVELTSQALSSAGVLECEFQIFDQNNVLLKVRGLRIFVLPCGDFSQAVESTSEFDVLTSAINTVNGMIQGTGNLSDLTTTEKSNIVGSINEVNAKIIPVSNGGTGATAVNGARSNLGITPTVLYDNESGTTGTITLSRDYTNFARIGVYAKGQYENASIYNEMCTSINYMNLAGTAAATTNYDCTVWRAAFMIFSGNTLRFETNCSSAYSIGAGYTISTGDGLKVTRVVGYDY